MYLVLEEDFQWNIENIEEEQVFEKADYGFRLVIPPSSVEEGQVVNTKIKVVAPENSDFYLPPNFEPVSCFYRIETTGQFSNPIELHLQHNVKLLSQEDSRDLAFVAAKGSPPYKFELLSFDIYQLFKCNDNSGILIVPDYSIFSIVQQKNSELQPLCNYVITIFFKQMTKFSWKIQAIVTKNLGPFLKVSI